MQKVEGSSPFSRSEKSPVNRQFSAVGMLAARLRRPSGQPYRATFVRDLRRPFRTSALSIDGRPLGKARRREWQARSCVRAAKRASRRLMAGLLLSSPSGRPGRRTCTPPESPLRSRRSWRSWRSPSWRRTRAATADGVIEMSRRTARRDYFGRLFSRGAPTGPPA
jgi:hypothetical protein